MAKTPRTWTGARTPSGLKRVRQAARRHDILRPAAQRREDLCRQGPAWPPRRRSIDGLDATVALLEALSALDRAAKAGAIHPNAAARRKSRLTRKVNAALGGAHVQVGGRVTKTTGKAAAAKAAKARIAAGKADKAKGAQTAAGKARAALSKTARAEAAAAKAAAATAAAETTPAKATATKAPAKAAATKAAPPRRAAEGDRRRRSRRRPRPPPQGRDREGRPEGEDRQPTSLRRRLAAASPRPTAPGSTPGASSMSAGAGVSRDRHGRRLGGAASLGAGVPCRLRTRTTPYSTAPPTPPTAVSRKTVAAVRNCSLQ